MSAPSRRSLLGATLALPVAAVPAIAKAANPDAELLAACAAFDVLERRMLAIHEPLQTPDEYKAADKILKPLQEEQHRLLDLMWDTPAVTLAGLGAKARSAVLWAPDFVDGMDSKSDGGAIVSSILRDLLGISPDLERKRNQSLVS